MNRIAIATTALVAAGTLAGPAFGADAAAIAPHVWSARIAGASPAVLNGTWRLAIKGGTFAVAKGTTLAVGGTVKIAGSRITFHDLGGSFACRGAQATGVYRWRVNGNRLTLAAVSDRCAGRKAILTRPFTRVL